MNILIAGASGFVGTNLIYHLKQNPKYNIRAMTRKLDGSTEEVDKVTWVKGNLYSLFDAELAMKDCDVAIYLVHSMFPTAQLSQGRFEDFDLILADNFARAADKNCVKQVIYLGGLAPYDQKELSTHLQSRLEVEDVFTSSPVPSTMLRASIIIGKNGSSFRIIENLVKKLPVLICPKWVSNATQPIDIRDVVRAIDHCLLNDKTYDKSFDLGSTEITSYLNMLKITSKLLGLKRIFISTSLISANISIFWVSLFGKQPIALVSPLIKSLRHELIANPFRSIPDFQYKYTDLVACIGYACSCKVPNLKKPKLKIYSKINYSVRSVTRLTQIPSHDAIWLARRYIVWLERFFNFIIIVSGTKSYKEFRLFNFIKLLKLKLSINRSTPKRQLFYIVGGILDKKINPHARIEFRLVGTKGWALAAIHDYYPTLPWGIYKYTQAIVHQIVMNRFKKYLEKQEPS